MEDYEYRYVEGYRNAVNMLESIYKEYHNEHMKNMRKTSGNFDKKLYDQVIQETDHLLLMSRMIRCFSLIDIQRVDRNNADAYNRGKMEVVNKVTSMIKEFEEYAKPEDNHSVCFLYELYERWCNELGI